MGGVQLPWFEKAIEQRRDGWKLSDIASEHNKSLQTVKNRFTTYNKTLEGEEERKPKFLDMGKHYIIYTSDREIEITKSDLRKLKELYCGQKFTINQVCRELDIPRRDFWPIRSAFSITKDDAPFLDEDFFEEQIDDLVDATLEQRKNLYFLKLEQKEIDNAFNELNKYRRKDYFIDKIHKLVMGKEFEHKPPVVSLRPMVRSCYVLEVPIVDLHYAKMSWAPESGSNYDVGKAEERFMNVIYDVIERSKNIDIEEILFPIGNDFFNFDTIYGATTKGTPQVNDVRWQEMFLGGNELLIRGIEALSQVAPVRVFQIPGNHDFTTSFYSIVNIASYFKANKNIVVDVSPKSRKYIEFGNCLIGFTHGDKEGKRIFGNMQVEAAESWGRTKYREWHTAHLHSEQVKEEFGIKVRRLSTVSATDDWHFESGYVGAIATSQSFLWDKHSGLREIWYSNVLL